jgi:hypothetical protein
MQGTLFIHSKREVWALVLLLGGLWSLAGCGKKSDYAVEEKSDFVKVEEPAAAKTSYYEHFEKNQAGEFDKPGQPAGWWDESNDAANNAEIEVTGQGAARITKVSDDVWGKVLSDRLTVDLENTNQLRVVVNKVDKNTGFKVLVQEPDQDEIQISETGDGAGFHTYDLKTKTGWSGVKTFTIILVVEAATNGVGTTLDEIWITSPLNGDAYLEHFNGNPGQPGGWWDYTNAPGNNAEIENSGAGTAKVFKAGKDVWGKVLSDRLKLDVDVNNTLSIVVNQIDQNVGLKVMLLEQGSSTPVEVSDPQLGAGVHRFNIPAKTGWTGEKNFSIMLVVEAKNNRLGARIDEIRIDESGF